MVACNFHVLGNSRKYPYHTTDSFLEFEEQGSWGGGEKWGLWTRNPKARGHGYDWNPEGMGGGGLDLEFLQETDKSVLHKTLIFWT